MVPSVLQAMAAPVELRPCAKLICTGFNGPALSPSKGAACLGADEGRGAQAESMRVLARVFRESAGV